MAMEMEEAELIETGDFIGNTGNFCTECAMMPCSCLLLYLDLKLKELSQDIKLPKEEEERSSDRASTEAEANDAGHQHQVLLGEADAQHRRRGQLHHSQLEGGEAASMDLRTALTEPPSRNKGRKRKAGGQLPHQWSGEVAHQNIPENEKKDLPDYTKVMKKKRKTVAPTPALQPGPTACPPPRGLYYSTNSYFLPR